MKKMVLGLLGVACSLVVNAQIPPTVLPGGGNKKAGSRNVQDRTGRERCELIGVTSGEIIFTLTCTKRVK